MRGVPPVDIIGLSMSPSTEPFWQAATEHRLVVPRCTSCGTFRLPPSPFCFNCRAQEVEWIDHDGAGEIYSFTILHRAGRPGFDADVPYVVALVELEEGPRVLTRIADVEPNDVRIGQPVRAAFVAYGDFAIPVFGAAAR